MRADELSARRTYEAMIQGGTGALVGSLLSVVQARAMQFESFGEFSAASGELWISAVAASVGLGPVAVKVYRSARVAKVYPGARGLRLVGPMLIILVSAFAYSVLVGAHALIYERTAVRLESFAAVLALLPLVCVSNFFRASAVAHGAAVAANVLNEWFSRALFLLALLGGIYLWSVPLGILTVAAIWVTTSTLILFAVWGLLVRVEPPYLRTGKRSYEMGGWIKTGASFALAALGLSVIDDGGVVVLGWVHADAGAAARFAAAASLGTILFAIATSVRSVYAPVLVEAIAKRNPAAIRAIFRLWFWRVGTAVLPLGLAMVIAGPWLLSLFGTEFSEAYLTLIILVIDYAIGAINLLFKLLYQYMGHEKETMVIMLVTAVIALIGMVVLGRYWGDVGVALSVTVALNAGVAVTAVLAWRELRAWERQAG